MGKAEQTRGCRYTTPGHKKHAKRRAKRLRRRAEKKNAETAPERIKDVTQGWTD